MEASVNLDFNIRIPIWISNNRLEVVWNRGKNYCSKRRFLEL